MDGPPPFFLALHPSFILPELTASHYMLIARTGSYISTLMGKAMAGWFLSSPGASDVKGVMRITAAFGKRSFGTAGKGRLKEAKCISDICDPSRLLSLPLFP